MSTEESMTGVENRGEKYLRTPKRGSVIAVLVVLTLLVAPSVGLAAENKVYVSGVKYSDKEPTTGDAVTITPTIKNSGSGSIQITQVDLSGVEEETEHSTVTDLGTVDSEGSIDVPLIAKFSSSGRKYFRVNVRGVRYGSGGDMVGLFKIQYPLSVSVEKPSSEAPTEPEVHIYSDPGVVGVEHEVRVKVSNGDDDSLSNLRLMLKTGKESERTFSRYLPKLEPWNDTTFEFTFEPSRSGTLNLESDLYYGDGHVTATEQVEISTLNEDVEVYASLNNNKSQVTYRITNYGNAPVHSVAIMGRYGETELPTAAIGTVEPFTSENVSVPVETDVASGKIDVKATYSVGSTTGKIKETIELSSSTARSGVQRGSLSNSWGVILILVSGLIGAAVTYFYSQRRVAE